MSNVSVFENNPKTWDLELLSGLSDEEFVGFLSLSLSEAFSWLPNCWRASVYKRSFKNKIPSESLSA